MWRSGSNKQNVRESIPNGSRRSIKLKSSDNRTQREHPTDETAFFNASQGGPEVQQEGQEKLIQLTAQCAQYFERFTAEKDHHLQVIGRAFAQISEKVEQAFGRIILETQRKLNEIRAFLVREHERLRVEKKEQEECLNSLLEEIKSVHLTRLQTAENMDLKEILADYAATLDKFFNIMMEIEGSSYEDGVEQCMNFINNLVKQELTTIISHKFPPKVDDLITGNFHEDCFTFELDGLRSSESTVSLLQERCSKQSTNHPNIFQQLQAIKTHQSARQSHINQYRTLISARDPFRAIRIPPS